MKNYIKGGIQGALFCVVILLLFYSKSVIGDGYVSAVMSGIAGVFMAIVGLGVFLISIIFGMSWTSTGLLADIIFMGSFVFMYFLLGFLVLGNYYQWREKRQPEKWISKNFPTLLILIIIVIAFFSGINSWIRYGQIQKLDQMINSGQYQIPQTSGMIKF